MKNPKTKVVGDSLRVALRGATQNDGMRVCHSETNFLGSSREESENKRGRRFFEGSASGSDAE